MPISAALASLIGTGLGTLGNFFDNSRRERGQTLANMYNSRAANAQRQWQEAQWHKQNEYNHPAAQMARLKNAGLNPNLIYGTSPSSAVGNASDVKGYSRAEAKNVSQGFDAFSNVLSNRNIVAQTNNVEAQTDVSRQEAINKGLQAATTILNNKHLKFDYGMKNALEEYSIQAAQASAETAAQNARAAQAEADVSIGTKDPRIKQAEQNLQILLKTKKGKELENALNQEKLRLRKEGIMDSDNILLRMLIKAAHNSPEYFKKLSDYLNSRNLLK